MTTRRPALELARLRAEVLDLEAYCAVLKGALMGADIEIPPPPRGSLARLTPQAQSLVGILLGAYPRHVHRYDILARLPSPGRRDLLDRDEKLVAVLVHGVRARLGPDVIENANGKGYRLSDEFRAVLVPCVAA